MGNNSVSGDGSNLNDIHFIKSRKDIEALGNQSKNLNNLNSIFNKLDNGNGILEEDEGFLYYYNDGTISAMKNNKMVMGVTSDGIEIEVGKEYDLYYR